MLTRTLDGCHLDADLAQLDDPCGAVGNGELWLKAGDLQTARLELQRIRPYRCLGRGKLPRCYLGRHEAPRGIRHDWHQDAGAILRWEGF